MEDGEKVVLHVQNDMVNSVVHRCPERWSSRLNAGCAERPPLTWLMKADPPSESCRIIRIVMDKFTTDEAPTSAGRQHWCLWIGARLVNTPTKSSCSSATTIDEAACTSSQPANSHNRGGHHDRARPPTLPIAKKRTVWPTVNACHLAVWWSAAVRRRPKQAMEGQMEAQSQ